MSLPLVAALVVPVSNQLHEAFCFHPANEQRRFPISSTAFFPLQAVAQARFPFRFCRSRQSLQQRERLVSVPFLRLVFRHLRKHREKAESFAAELTRFRLLAQMAQVSGDSACRAGAGSEGGKQEKNRLAPLASDDEFSLSGAYRQLKSGK